MPTRLDAAAKSHRAAQAAHTAALRRAEDARDKADQARARVAETRAELAAAIVEEARAGARQVDLARASGLTRERVRQIVRAAGIDPE